LKKITGANRTIDFYYGCTYAEGKNITWRDGLKAIRILVQVRLRRG